MLSFVFDFILPHKVLIHFLDENENKVNQQESIPVDVSQRALFFFKCQSKTNQQTTAKQPHLYSMTRVIVEECSND